MAVFSMRNVWLNSRESRGPWLGEGSWPPLAVALGLGPAPVAPASPGGPWSPRAHSLSAEALGELSLASQTSGSFAFWFPPNTRPHPSSCQQSPGLVQSVFPFLLRAPVGISRNSSAFCVSVSLERSVVFRVLIVSSSVYLCCTLTGFTFLPVQLPCVFIGLIPRRFMIFADIVDAIIFCN